MFFRSCALKLSESITTDVIKMTSSQRTVDHIKRRKGNVHNLHLSRCFCHYWNMTRCMLVIYPLHIYIKQINYFCTSCNSFCWRHHLEVINRTCYENYSQDKSSTVLLIVQIYMCIQLIDTDSACGTRGLVSSLNTKQQKCCPESVWLISLCTPNSGLKCWLRHMSLLFTGLEEIRPPCIHSPADLQCYLTAYL